MGYDLEADRLLLHTIQTAEAFNTLVRTGMLRPDPALAEAYLADAYDWMYRMMAARLPIIGQSALWLRARTRCEDLAASCRRARGQVS